MLPDATGYLAAALGGALGALARWGVAQILPHSPGAWPAAMLVVNLTGCLLMGVLIAVLPARFPAHPWLRPFLATGVSAGSSQWPPVCCWAGP
jgi:CrcB protein